MLPAFPQALIIQCVEFANFSSSQHHVKMTLPKWKSEKSALNLGWHFLPLDMTPAVEKSVIQGVYSFNLISYLHAYRIWFILWIAACIRALCSFRTFRNIQPPKNMEIIWSFRLCMKLKPSHYWNKSLIILHTIYIIKLAIQLAALSLTLLLPNRQVRVEDSWFSYKHESRVQDLLQSLSISDLVFEPPH